MIVLSNPRNEVTIEDWPHGRRRVTADFEIESKKTGKGSIRQRCARTTTGKPKKTTYAVRMKICDGDDGRIYIVGLTEYGQIIRIPGTLKGAEYFYAPKDPEAEAYCKLCGWPVDISRLDDTH